MKLDWAFYTEPVPFDTHRESGRDKKRGREMVVWRWCFLSGCTWGKRILKHMLLVILIAASITGCGKQTSKEPEFQENTEEYFKAHGIVPGQVNELRIGGTLFRFPAGVGLNPYTAQEAIRTIDGSPMTLSSKECLEQGKCERVATPIVRGQADKVTFYLIPELGYAPNPSPFGGGVKVEIQTVNEGYADRARKAFAERINGVEGLSHPEWGLKRYQPTPEGRGGDIYESLSDAIRWPSGEKITIGCQSDGDPVPGQPSLPSGICGLGYVDSKAGYLVYVQAGKVITRERWQDIVPAVVRYIDFVVVK